MPNSNAPVGVVIVARHGDRSAFYREHSKFALRLKCRLNNLASRREPRDV